MLVGLGVGPLELVLEQDGAPLGRVGATNDLLHLRSADLPGLHGRPHLLQL